MKFLDIPDLALAAVAEYLGVRDLGRLSMAASSLHKTVAQNEFQRREALISEEQRAHYASLRQRVTAYELSRKYAMEMTRQCRLHEQYRCHGCVAYPDFTDAGYNRDFIIQRRNYFVLFTNGRYDVLWGGFVKEYAAETGPLATFLLQQSRIHANADGDASDHDSWLIDFQTNFLDESIFQLNLSMENVSLSQDQIQDEELHVTVVDFEFCLIPGQDARQRLFYSSQGFQTRADSPNGCKGSLHLFRDKFLDTHSCLGDYATAYLFWGNPSPQITTLSVIHVDHTLEDSGADATDDDISDSLEWQVEMAMQRYDEGARDPTEFDDDYMMDDFDDAAY